MLVLKRKEGQWVEIIHRSGDVIRLRVYDIQAAAGVPSRTNLAFDDAARNFEIRRPERRMPTPKPEATEHPEPEVEPPLVLVAEAAVAIDPELGLSHEGAMQEVTIETH
ncbi:hypothetical protein [Tautonia marina]|uniref:hypothetical protein n=1 Tax=Tautonia marina TaxID=2653855 RepID=UPI001260A96E|nr:hypothetical protein [Tautonia marina]